LKKSRDSKSLLKKKHSRLNKTKLQLELENLLGRLIPRRMPRQPQPKREEPPQKIRTRLKPSLWITQMCSLPQPF
jgi:hypothetical protein